MIDQNMFLPICVIAAVLFAFLLDGNMDPVERFLIIGCITIATTVVIIDILRRISEWIN